MSDSQFTAPLAHPFYDDHVKYFATVMRGRPVVRGWEFGGWRRESMSWKTGCYIHAGLSGGPIEVKGPYAQRYLQGLVINSLERFPVGTMKHAVQCDEDGLIFAHGIIERRREDAFYAFAGGPPAGSPPPTPGEFDVELNQVPEYLFQIAGPKSLEVLEKVTGESLRDIGFLSFRDASISGRKTEVARLGMSGNLAYELHGPLEEGPEIYQAVYEAGREFGVERLGWRTYLVNHVEGGFPQGSWTFIPTGYDVDDMLARGTLHVSGSVARSDMRARRRTPVEVRWQNMARFDHDFIGMDAVKKEIEHPTRTTMTLRWNPEDVIAIYASLFEEGETYTPIDLPCAPERWPMAHADHILKDGREVGWSSGTTYSYYFRELISMACIDLDQAEIGNEVIVQWGDHGGRIKDVRATVERFPYLTEGRNRELDVNTV